MPRLSASWSSSVWLENHQREGVLVRLAVHALPRECPLTDQAVCARIEGTADGEALSPDLLNAGGGVAVGEGLPCHRFGECRDHLASLAEGCCGERGPLEIQGSGADHFLAVTANLHRCPTRQAVGVVHHARVTLGVEWATGDQDATVLLAERRLEETDRGAIERASRSGGRDRGERQGEDTYSLMHNQPPKGLTFQF